MSLAPLLNAAPAMQLHAFAAMAAFALGIVQFAAPKGTLLHRTPGRIWVAADAGDERLARSDSSAFGCGGRGARSTSSRCSPRSCWRSAFGGARHHVAATKIMIVIFAGALVLAGLFTLVPGRIMHARPFRPLRRPEDAVRIGHGSGPREFRWPADCREAA